MDPNRGTMVDGHLSSIACTVGNSYGHVTDSLYLTVRITSQTHFRVHTSYTSHRHKEICWYCTLPHCTTLNRGFALPVPLSAIDSICAICCSRPERQHANHTKTENASTKVVVEANSRDSLNLNPNERAKTRCWVERQSSDQNVSLWKQNLGPASVRLGRRPNASGLGLLASHMATS